jgi:hypothetical protein
MRRLWPGIELKERKGEVKVTCDVDEPYDSTLRSPWRVARRVAGDLIKRRSLGTASSSVSIAWARAMGDWSKDPNNTFGWMMDECERSSLSMTFYFIGDHTAGALDGCYHLDEPFILDLIAAIRRRGHDIGTHGSYESWLDAEQLRKERLALERAAAAAGVPTTVTENRQHYLRWDAARTPALLQDAGYAADSTGGYADSPGFRYGTARPFPMWDLHASRSLRVRQRPLVVMESSIVSPLYLGMGYSEAAWDLFHTLKCRSLDSGGDFTFLWHNNHLATAADREFYRALISGSG